MTPAEVEEVRREKYEQRLRELEGGCRVLKLAMGAAADRTREQMLYRFELRARRAQRDTPGWEKILSDLYGALSGYGSSLLRPFIAAALLHLSFGAVFFALALGLDRFVQPNPVVGRAIVDDAWNALTFSWTNIFQPFSALGADAQSPDESWTRQLLFEFPSGFGFAVRMLATFESLIAIVLVFLFALAVRRRFQMD
jgi:hypothetical protein